MANELLTIVEAIHREKRIEKDVIFEALEAALTAAARKKIDLDEEENVLIDRVSGAIGTSSGEPLDMSLSDLGRVAAQVAKQVMIQKMREAERDVVFDEYIERSQQLVAGRIQRFEKGNVIVSLGNAEGIVPRREQVRDETYTVGNRLRCFVLEVKKIGHKVRIVLSRAHPELVKRLFEAEIPEVAERVIEIKGVVREPGYRTKIAVVSFDPRVDPVGACVGVRGTRINSIKDELNGEKIDIIPWNDSAEVLIKNALKPAQVSSITLDYDNRRARVVVPDDQLSLAIGRGGQNVRLATRLCKWNVDVMNESEEIKLAEKTILMFSKIEGVGEVLAEKLFNAGYTTIEEIVSGGVDGLTMVEGVGEKRAEEVIDYLRAHSIEAPDLSDIQTYTEDYRPDMDRESSDEESESPLTAADELFRNIDEGALQGDKKN